MVLIDRLETCGVMILNCMPSAFYPLVESVDDSALARLASLRLVVLGGEPVDLSRLQC